MHAQSYTVRSDAPGIILPVLAILLPAGVDLWMVSSVFGWN